MRSPLLPLAAALVLACVSRREAEIEVTTLQLTITGMTCAVDCPARVVDALESVPGVESARVDYDARTATVVCRGCNPAALVVAVRRQGFGAVAR